MSMDKEDIRQLIAQSCLCLDEEDYDGFLQICSSDFTYFVKAFSPDLGMEMVWMDHDHPEFVDMCAMIPKHVRMSGSISRHVNVSLITEISDRNAKVTSKILLVHTGQEGTSTILATGKYVDQITVESNELRIKARNVSLETRKWNPGLHVPI